MQVEASQMRTGWNESEYSNNQWSEGRQGGCHWEYLEKRISYLGLRECRRLSGNGSLVSEIGD